MIRHVVRLTTVLVVFWLLAPLSSAEATAPPVGPPAYVLDDAHVLPPAVAQQISGELAAYEGRTAHQLAVVTVPTLGGRDVQTYSRDLFDAWGIGRAGVDDGGLLLVATKERKIRLQVGQGLRDAGLTDDAAVRIIDEITPTLHQDDFAGGLVAGEREMRRTLGDTALATQQKDVVAHFGGGQAIAADAGHASTNPVVLAAVLTVFGVLVAGVFVVAIRGIRRDLTLGGGGSGDAAGGGWGGGFMGGGGGGGGGAAGGGGGASGGF